MRFSVLIPVYNVEKYLKICIESVLSQDYSDYDIILVDDGSKDNSGSICDYYQREFPDVVKVIHQNNGGLLKARRIAINAADGDYFVFLDSDDYLFPNALKFIDDAIKRYDADMVLYNYYKESTSSIIKLMPDVDYKIFDETNKYELYKQILTGAYLNAMWIKAVKKEVVDINEDYSNYYSILMGEDLVQSLPLYTNAKKIIYIDKCLLFYRSNRNGLTYNWRADYFYSYQICQKILYRYMKIWNIGEKVREEVYCNTAKTVCDYLEYAYREQKETRGKFFEIYRAILKDTYLKDIVVIYGKKNKQPKYRVYAQLIRQNNQWGLFIFTWIVVHVISVKTKF